MRRASQERGGDAIALVYSKAAQFMEVGDGLVPIARVKILVDIQRPRFRRVLMPKRVQVKKPSVPPTLSPQQAIALLKRQAERADEIASLHFNDPKIEVWRNSTTNILSQAFGQPNGEMHPNTRDFAYADGGVSLHVNMSDSEVQAEHEGKARVRKALLLGFVEQLQDLAPPGTATASDQYIFHSEIECVSGALFGDGHYKQAALEAYIRVIDEVKAVSGLPEDGDPLMNRAFGIDKQTPVIQFNTLTTDAERDEQRGIMYLFKGIVGLRNSKAHSNRLFNDACRAMNTSR